MSSDVGHVCAVDEACDEYIRLPYDEDAPATVREADAFKAGWDACLIHIEDLVREQLGRE